MQVTLVTAKYKIGSHLLWAPLQVWAPLTSAYLGRQQGNCFTTVSPSPSIIIKTSTHTTALRWPWP